MDTSQALWRKRLGSAFRTVLACSIVGCTVLYGPKPVRHFLAYPAFSYVTTILIVPDATFGDALRGCWHVFCASIQVLFPSMLSLWLIGPSKFNPELAALAVGLTSFFIALPDSTHLTAKRIAFGQTVIVYVGTVIKGAKTEVMIHPVHVASNAALGALASVLALLVPFPHLAYREVRKTCRFYAEDASKRLNLLVEAFCAKDNMAAHNLITEAGLSSKTGAKLLQNIKDKHEGMLWEKPWFRFIKSKRSDPAVILQEMEIPIQGMELALTTCSSFPIRMIDEELQSVLQVSKRHIALKLEQATCSVHFDAATAPEIKGEFTDWSFLTQRAISTIHEDLSPFFFLYCMKLLQDGPVCNGKEAKIEKPSQPKKLGKNTEPEPFWCRLLSFGRKVYSKHLVFAVKCSLALGFAVLLGLLYDKRNALWSGLTIAISFVSGHQATFTMANARAQGTVMGSVYAILCSFVFQKITDYRFLLLLPWIFFASFLRHSRMYGHAGGITAIIGAALILGRNNYSGTPSEFAIARITEVIIGLTCFITVEIVLQPTRSTTLAKKELAKTLGALQDCSQVISLYTRQSKMSQEVMREKHKMLKYHANKLESFIAEAELEPNFWFKPFHCSCYNMVLRTIQKMADLLHFQIHQIEFLSQESHKLGINWEEIRDRINNDLKYLTDKSGSLMKCLDDVFLAQSLAELEKESEMENISHDLELGDLPNADVSTSLGHEENNTEGIGISFLQQAMAAVNKVEGEVEEKLKSQVVLYLSSLWFCTNNLKKEATEMEKLMAELLTWENSARHVNLW